MEKSYQLDFLENNDLIPLSRPDYPPPVPLKKGEASGINV
jgi:hypothetical protein